MHRASSVENTFIIAGDDYMSYKDTFAALAELLKIPPSTRTVHMPLAIGHEKIIEISNTQRGIDNFVMHSSVFRDMIIHWIYANTKAKKIKFFVRTGAIIMV